MTNLMLEQMAAADNWREPAVQLSGVPVSFRRLQHCVGANLDLPNRRVLVVEEAHSFACLAARAARRSVGSNFARYHLIVCSFDKTFKILQIRRF